MLINIIIDNLDVCYFANKTIIIPYIYININLKYKVTSII